MDGGTLEIEYSEADDHVYSRVTEKAAQDEEILQTVTLFEV